MLDFFLNILEAQIDYQSVFLVVILWFLFLWVAFCVWVYMDANKRYKNPMIALTFFVVVVIFNFPALIFYLIIRPEKEEDNVLYLHGNEDTTGGINVPLIKFEGDDGMTINLQLKVSKKSDMSPTDMKVNVDWISQNPGFKVEATNTNKVESPTIKSQSEVVVDSAKTSHNLKATSKELTSKLKDIANRFTKNVKSYQASLDEDEPNKEEKTPKIEDVKTES